MASSIDRTMGLALSVDDVPEATLHPMPSFREFWESLRNKQLLVRRCIECGTLFSPARVSCPKCFSTSEKLRWKKSKGTGEVYSYSTVYVAFDKDLNEVYCKSKLPYTFALVKLDEGVYMTSNIVECEPSLVRIGMRVKIAFDVVKLPKIVPKLSQLKLPPFRPILRRNSRIRE